ncbi:uncharacterized protein LOC120154969 [Hibiscus syriacus]|uniref:uncharacterized protein LOC120154969 n=1 Tax=Hibiscus syriacus TaxID=106335 RepID=UPI001923D08C|nr:uncharacterized protein LOC120154969 [Hibiscus syriacus]
MELILRLYEAQLGNKREKTREMEEQLRADIAALDAKENERLMLVSERDQKLAVKKAVDKLVSEFLHAEDDKNFDTQKGMKEEIVALLRHHDGRNTAGSDGSVNGENTGELENAQNQDERIGVGTIVGKDCYSG